MIKKLLPILPFMVLWILVLQPGLLGFPNPAVPNPEEFSFRANPRQSAGNRQVFLSVSGELHILWGDSQTGKGGGRLLYFLHTNQGRTIRLALPVPLPLPMAELIALRGEAVTIEGEWLTPPSSEGQAGTIRVLRLQGPEGMASPRAPSISGPQPWVSVLCKFSDNASEPKPVSYFQNMYGAAFPGLDHYWKENSYNTINLFGSTTVGQWYSLPHPHSWYVYDIDGDGKPDLDFGRAADDCTGAAEADIDFPSYVGINLMFNEELDGNAWGGSQTMTRNGQTLTWYTTWEPPWGYADITVIEHEMGHGFGLPHSSYNPALVYDNRWDVMSDTWTDCNNSRDAVYGCLGQHTIAYHKNLNGWIPAERRFLASPGSQATITLQQLALPPAGNYLMVQIPIGGSSTHFYTVEARRKTGYDVKLPGEAVIIHEVDANRSIPALVIDTDSNGNTGDAGAMWTVGETFQDNENDIWVRVEAATGAGYVVTVSNAAGSATRTPTASPTFTATATPTQTRTATPTPTMTDTATVTQTPTPTTTSTHTASPTATETGTPTPTCTATPTLTQTPVAEVTVQSVWTADGSQQVKTSFSPGEEIRYFGEVVNSSSNPETADFVWDVSGPCGRIAYYAGPLEASPGTMDWQLPSEIPADACGGSYQYQLSVTFHGITSTKVTTFTVVSPITPTPTRTATPSATATGTTTATKTATVVASPRKKVYLPVICRR